MNTAYFIAGATIVNEGEKFRGSVLVRNGLIEKIYMYDLEDRFPGLPDNVRVIKARGKYLLPGVIDDQVHFREPGLTDKGDIYTESKAAVAGGVTSYMDMPNTVPNTLTQELLEAKYRLAEEKSLANFSFYMGASNDNIAEILRTDPSKVCGIKVFMGSSTGNMLVDNIDSLNEIFAKSKAVHCEDEETIRNNTRIFQDKYYEHVPMEAHPLIRSDKACYKSTLLAVGLAKIYHTRLHVLHLSTAMEMSLFDNKLPLQRKRITAEVCVHHLWFNSNDYIEKGTLIKWNPAIKTRPDQQALFQAMLDNRIDVVATDHAPHTLEEKNNLYFRAPSGGPLVQHSLPAMLDFYKTDRMTIEKVVEKMCHAPAICFQVEKRGFIREGYWADLVLVDPEGQTPVEKSNLLYKCGWSPFEGHTFKTKVTHTFVNGNLVYNEGKFDERVKGQRLLFDR